MSNSLLKSILGREEEETVDFKEKYADLTVKANRYKFIKDIISMANTPRTNPAYIVIGIRKEAGEKADIIGLSKQYDDAELQATFTSGIVEPRPRFLYTPYFYEEKHVGIIEIPVQSDGPYIPIKNYPGLTAGVIYYRRGTTNGIAGGPESKRIHEWFAKMEGTIDTLPQNIIKFQVPEVYDVPNKPRIKNHCFRFSVIENQHIDIYNENLYWSDHYTIEILVGRTFHGGFNDYLPESHQPIIVISPIVGIRDTHKLLMKINKSKFLGNFFFIRPLRLSAIC